jgi:urease accessory protein
MSTDAALVRLLAWLSPSFPIGAYTYSHGLEWAVEEQLVTDRATLVDWVDTVLRHGAGRVDASLLLAAHRAVATEDEALFVFAAERGEAMRGTTELALETSAQGAAFLTTVKAAWPLAGLERWTAILERESRAASQPVAVGLCAALAGVEARPALVGYLFAMAANLVSAAVRLVPLGQTDGQRSLHALESCVGECADAALARPAGDLASAAMMVDWASARHETQYTRLFRS